MNKENQDVDEKRNELAEFLLRKHPSSYVSSKQ